MPFLSRSQRRKFYALKNDGKMDQKTIDEWEENTTKNIPERLHKKAGAHMIDTNFWAGFNKKAVETFVSAEQPMQTAGSPEKMLKWNDHGGVDPRTPEDLQSALAAGLVTLSPEVPGASCGTCMHFRLITEKLAHGFCTHPNIKMDVTDHMHCAHWENPESHNPAEAAEQEAQQQQAEDEMAAQQQAAQPQAGQPQAGQQPSFGGGAVLSPKQPQQSEQAPQQPSPEEPQGIEGPSAKGSDPSAIGRQSGFPAGSQTSANPLVSQAVDDFQGQGSSAAATDQGGAGPSTTPKKKPTDKQSKGHTININVDKSEEKKASINYWGGVVPGY